MKKYYYFIFLMLGGFLACNKNVVAPTKDTSKTEVSKKQDSIRTNKLEGPCPYDCHDQRCIAYQNGYCGTSTDTAVVRTNSSNPYDYIGSNHNNGLTYVLNNNSGASSIRHLTNVYMVSHNYDTTSVNNTINYGTQHGYYNPNYNVSTDDAKAGLNKALSDGIISNTVYTYFSSLISIFDNLSQTDATTTSAANYSNLANQVVSLESQIASDNSLSNTERQQLYSATSTARYSANYWTNYGLRQSGSAPQSINQPVVIQSDGKKILRSGSGFSWGSLGKADVYGAVGGALAGVAVTLATGATTLGTAILAGAVGGAVENSAVNALGQLFGN